MGADQNNQVCFYDNGKQGTEEQKAMIIIMGSDDGMTWSSSSSTRSASSSAISYSSDVEDDSSSLNGSSESSFSSELLDDDDASSSSSSLQSHGALNDLSSLNTHLPAIKSGLSRFYKGKSQSFTSLEVVENIEDLAKKGNPCNNRKLKYCKSYAAGLNNYHKPKPTITKKNCSSLSCLNKKGGSSFNSRSCRLSLMSQIESNF